MQSLFFSSSPNSVPYSESSSHFYPGLIIRKDSGFPQGLSFPSPPPVSGHLSSKQLDQTQEAQGEQSDGIKTQSMATALPAVFAFLKNNAKHHKCFKGGILRFS